MIGRQDIERTIGATARDNDGNKVGSVETVFIDDQTGEPTFVVVKSGLFGSRASLVPLTGAVLRDDELRLAHSRDRIADAPNVDADGHLSPNTEAELYRYYGLSYTQEFGETMRDDAESAPRPGDPASGRQRLRRHA